MEEVKNRLKMQEEPEVPQGENAKKPEKAKMVRRNRLRIVLEGSFLTREKVISQLPYLIFLTFIGLAYIFNSNYADKTVIRISRTKNQLEELRFDYINTKSKLMQATRQSELVHRLENRGVKESKIPPRKIIVQESAQ